MAVLEILTAPDPRLKKKARPVEVVDDGIRRLMDDMLETMYRAPGVGLAAPQVGVRLRVIVLDVASREKGELPNPMALANPEIIAREGTLSWEEGCLSLPDHFAQVERAAFVRVRALDREGREVVVEGEGLLAVCLQHELDHLDGILFVDHISRLKREIILAKLTRKKKATES